MPTKSNYKIVIDTNIWIYFLLGKSFLKISNIITTKNLQVLFSKELVNEIESVFRKPKFKGVLDYNDFRNLVLFFETIGTEIIVSSNVELCRDVKDNFLLNLSIDGKADFLITEDKDLLVLDKINETVIITYNHFLRQI